MNDEQVPQWRTCGAAALLHYLPLLLVWHRRKNSDLVASEWVYLEMLIRNGLRDCLNR